MCLRRGATYLPLRGASVASFAAALASSPLDTAEGESLGPFSPGCPKNK
jgi:hypothetical protein